MATIKSYSTDDETKKEKKNLLSYNGLPSNNNSYASQLEKNYNLLKKQGTFNYDSQNDGAYRQWADQAKAMNGLAIAGNQQQAQGLTGGYGSTYAPAVANQGLSNLNSNISSAQPNFLTAAQNIYQSESERKNNAFDAVLNAYEANSDDYANKLNAYNENYQQALTQYQNSQNFNYQKYTDNLDYQNTSYDTYNSLAQIKCAKYNDAKNNSGMKAYLNGLVKAGKITQYMADNLYDQYKYTASSSGSSGSSKSKSSGTTSNSSNNSSETTAKTQTAMSKYGFTEAQLKAVGLSKNTSADTLDALIDNGTIIYNTKMNTLTKKQENVFKNSRSGVTGETSAKGTIRSIGFTNRL